MKVFFILAIALASVISVVIAFDTVGSYQDDYMVRCNYGNNTTFLAFKDKEIYISPYYDYTSGLANLSDDTKQELRSACGISQETVDEKASRIFDGTDDGKKLFDLVKRKVVTDTYLTASLWSILSLAIIFIVSEIIKRTFYYVVLGTIRPRK